MLTSNINTLDGLVNGTKGIVSSFIRSSEGVVQYVLVKFDNDEIGKEARISKPSLASKLLDENKKPVTPIGKIEWSYNLGKRENQHGFVCFQW